MKTLLLLRHAKSSWSDLNLDDHDRPLNERGMTDAPRMGALLVKEKLLPDVVLCSTAVRARVTAETVARSSGYSGSIQLDKRLYHADPEQIVRVILELGDHAADRVMVVGHNPGLEELIETVTKISTALPTGALARIDLALERWGSWQRKTKATLVRIFRPKELTS